MFRRSQRVATANDHASLWPFYALRRLTFWAGVLGAGYGALLALLADAPAAVPLLGLGAAVAVFALGLIPAVALSVLDTVFVRPRRLRGSLPARSRTGSRRQSLLHWAVAGGATGAAVGLGYAVVYLNAFAPTVAIDRLLATSVNVAMGAGLATGLLTAIKLDTIDYYLPATGLTPVLKRGAFLWATTVAGTGVLGFVVQRSSYEKTLLPAAILAIVGAGVVPQLAASPATRLISDSSGQFPIAPSPRPIDPEGGQGEGAKGAPKPAGEREHAGDRHSAPPPEFRNTTRPTMPPQVWPRYRHPRR